MRELLVVVICLASGCATCSKPGTMWTMDGTPERKIASTAYMGGTILGFAGCVAGFAGVPFMVPVCLGGWAGGIGGISYLAYDDQRPTCKTSPEAQ